MKKIILGVVCFCVVCFCDAGTGFTYPIAENFVFPIDGYTDDECLDWGDYGYGQYAGQKHLADDYCVYIGTDVQAIGNGRVKYTLYDPTNATNMGWYGLIIIEHTLPNGDQVCSLYGHARATEVSVGDEVVVDQKIGEIIEYPDSSNHIHFGIYNGAFGADEGTYPSWTRGYVLPLNFPGNYLDPILFIQSHQSDLTRGLVAHYPFNNNANDESGNGHDGTEYGGVSYENGILGQAVSFDGVDGWINIDNKDPFKLDEWTISTWIKVRELPSLQVGCSVIGKDDDSNWKYNFSLIMHKNGHIASQYETCSSEFDHGVGSTAEEDKINLNQWYFVTSDRDRETGRHSLWINLFKVDEEIWLDTPCQNDEYLMIAKSAQENQARYLNCVLDETYIHNRALSEAERQQLFWQTLGIAHGKETILKEELTIYLGDEIDISVTIPDHCAQSTISRIIKGSDVEMSLILPDGITIINRDTQDQDVHHILGSTYEAYQITNPAPGQWTVRLKGTDVPAEGEIVNLTVSVDAIPNQLPIADAGPSQTVAVGTDCMATVILDGLGSSDPDGNTLTYTWTWDSGSATGMYPIIQLPLGSFIITLVVNDGIVDSEPDTVQITVVDETLPEISVTAVPDVLWPPNHKMVDINFTVEASDNCDADLDIVLDSVVSNEPDDVSGGGDGHTENDIQNAEFGTEDYTISLRAERQGKGDGRIYTITYTATDDFGNSATASATVTVLHNKNPHHKRIGIKK